MREEIVTPLTIMTTIIVVSGMFVGAGLKGCVEATERDRAIGVACAQAGGAWVRSGDSFQCVHSK